MENGRLGSRLGRHGKIIRQGWFAAANPRLGDSRQPARDGGQCAGGLCIHFYMVAVVEDLYRARAFAETVLRDRHRRPHGNHRRTSPSTRAREGGETSVLRTRVEEEVIKGNATIIRLAETLFLKIVFVEVCSLIWQFYF